MSSRYPGFNTTEDDSNFYDSMPPPSSSAPQQLYGQHYFNTLTSMPSSLFDPASESQPMGVQYRGFGSGYGFHQPIHEGYIASSQSQYTDSDTRPYSIYAGYQSQQAPPRFEHHDDDRLNASDAAGSANTSSSHRDVYDRSADKNLAFGPPRDSNGHLDPALVGLNPLARSFAPQGAHSMQGIRSSKRVIYEDPSAAQLEETALPVGTEVASSTFSTSTPTVQSLRDFAGVYSPDFTSTQVAEDYMHGPRQKLEIDGGDDWLEIEKDPHAVAKLFFEAMTTTPAGPPSDQELTEEQKARWTKWQNGANDMFKSQVLADPERLIASSYLLVQALLRVRKQGVSSKYTEGTKGKPRFKADMASKCSEIVASVIDILKDIAIADLDMINGKAMEELVTSPEHYLKHEVANCWNNGRKQQDELERKRLKGLPLDSRRRRKSKAVKDDSTSQDTSDESAAVPRNEKITPKRKLIDEDDAVAHGENTPLAKSDRDGSPQKRLRSSARLRNRQGRNDATSAGRMSALATSFDDVSVKASSNGNRRDARKSNLLYTAPFAQDEDDEYDSEAELLYHQDTSSRPTPQKRTRRNNRPA